jgi:hypothetical protein
MKRKAANNSVPAGKEFVTIWWTCKLIDGRLSAHGSNIPLAGAVYINGELTKEKVHEVLNRLQGEVVGHSQAVYTDLNNVDHDGYYTQSWTVCVHKNT